MEGGLTTGVRVLRTLRPTYNRHRAGRESGGAWRSCGICRTDRRALPAEQRAWSWSGRYLQPSQPV